MGISSKLWVGDVQAVVNKHTVMMAAEYLMMGGMIRPLSEIRASGWKTPQRKCSKSVPVVNRKMSFETGTDDIEDAHAGGNARAQGLEWRLRVERSLGWIADQCLTVSLQ